ncbi:MULTISPECIES: tRNA pseudouridine(38-40) synthase TruA [unclassified Herbaspirillum]|uniref:tRNA pseudouridine synthase A n=1 Tax=unclassified Herbaspirillum TaxID=2624150 RepID=UPI0011527AF8|nr:MULTISPECIES: tRNA pseudouridine synthase A [unclassified Herbaspirillum]MBB5391921.1 tRNA pseudouridine38-40 synthase [Herbaspirillum sp. SJZ102]TQK13381.1 tRNA pseudouridine38-40 synthase [Herbaspirillum sp. SJZ130]TQK15385.1 tRNA pseudouridine38-40 synthase [Herbaspirillum sp. SJZ106]TWC71280.1 tRNA pseudouridine38-40 synthase [Herbaspirillum sp. SJZ099]
MTDTSGQSGAAAEQGAGLRRVALGVQYDGSQWQGWQTQPHRQTVQDQLEAALERFTLQRIATTCAGRTDSGVHALEQVVHFDTAIARDLFSWVRGTNAFLPPSIAVRWACELPYVDDAAIAALAAQTEEAHGAGRTAMPAQFGFHARFSAVARTYHYVLYNHPVRSPLLAGKAGWTFRPLDAERMHRAAQHLIGEHDFTSFRAVECQAKSPVRQMESITVRRHGDMIVFTLKANAFLHHMVRNIVGSLIFVGNGNQPPEWIAQVLAQRDRSRAAPTFMPDGLYLARVDYPDTWALPQEARAWPWL